jgi:effector-binding domain-containing protein
MADMTYDVTFADLQTQTYAVVDLEVDSPEAIGAIIGPAFEEVAQVVARQGMAPAGPPVAHYIPSATTLRVVAGFPVAGMVRPEGRVRGEIRPGGRVALTTHAGQYDTVPEAYSAAREYAVDNGHVCDEDWWERYLDAPDVARPRTEVLVPCRLVEPRSAEARTVPDQAPTP